ncbi:MAG: threonyl-tRNA synthetase editing domain-containing protein, partial [Candidatus Caldatribacteriota bacterium]|nr:threonyl-tRNA synthetase editing domain-containing protein [Candidatus Caldatribacteriota bacterium]
NAEKRLENAGYKTRQTPFGYFLDLDLKAPGKSLARVFKEF